MTNFSNNHFNVGAIDWNDNASVRFGNDYDAYKLYNPWPLPNLAISFEEDSLETQVNAVPTNLGYHFFRLGAYSPLPGNFELDFTWAIKDQVCLILEDLVLDSLIDISVDSNYQFILDTSYHSPRFILHVSDFTKSIEKENLSCFQSNDGQIELELDPVNSYNVELLDSNQALISQKLASKNLLVFDSLVAQIYTLKIEGDGALCQQEEFLIELFEPREIQAIFSSPDTQLISLGAVQFTNQSSGAGEFTWTFGDGNSSTEFSPMHTYMDSGTYQVHLRSEENACTAEFTKSIRINAASASSNGKDFFDALQLQYSFIDGRLSITSMESELKSVQLLDLQGKLVFEKKLLSGRHFTTSLDLPRAIYILHISHDQGQQNFKLTYQ